MCDSLLPLRGCEIGRSNEQHSADDSDSEAKQRRRIRANIAGGTKEGRDLGGGRTVSVVAVRASSVDTSASSTGGASLVAAARAGWRSGRGIECHRERGSLGWLEGDTGGRIGSWVALCAGSGARLTGSILLDVSFASQWWSHGNYDLRWQYPTGMQSSTPKRL